MEIYSGSNYITASIESVIGLYDFGGIFGSDYNDENKNVTLMKTNVTGLFFIPIDMTLGGYPPLLRHGTGDYNNFVPRMIGMPVINKEFKGVPYGTVVSASSLQFIVTDDNEPDNGTHQKGKAIIDFSIPVQAMDFKLVATCQYTLSDNGSIDFGDQRVTQITDDRNTTVKRSMTLNMDKCYGVNKVKTTITTTAPTAESGLLLGNGVADGAKNVAVALRVNPNYTESGAAGENTGKDMYFDSSNPLEWNFGNAYTVDPMSKHIPLDVWLLRNGGEPTPGDYHATATIMMDFI
jgi:type 1 fimbria pilin